MSTEPEANEVVEPVVEEVVEPVEAQEEVAEEGEEDENQDDLQERKPRVRNAQARIDQLTREKNDARREADHFRRLATATAPTPPAGASTKPTSDQFDDYGEFVEALTDWKASDVLRKAAEKTHGSIREDDWSSKVEAAKSTLTDFDSVVGSSEIPIADHVRDALLEADRGPELAYHMATHPDYAERLNGMSASRAAIELGRLESTLDAPVIKRASNAPAPITPIRGGPTVKVDLNKASMDDYITERRRQGATF